LGQKSKGASDEFHVSGQPFPDENLSGFFAGKNKVMEPGTQNWDLRKTGIQPS